MDVKGHFPLITLSDTKVTISRLEIDNRENFVTLDMVEKVVYEKDRMAIFASDSVKTMKVHAELNFPNFFL